MTSDVKLTLKLNEESIQRAKEYAAKKGISLSKLIENFFDSITLANNLESPKNDFYSPLVKELSGIIKINDDLDVKDDYENYLMQKYE